MSTLADVLGSLFADVLRARMAADALTAEVARTYRDDPVLAALSVPRITVSDVTVHVRYLVTEVEEATRPPLDVDRFTRDWNARVDRLLRRIGARFDAQRRAAVDRLRDALRDEPVALDVAMLQALLDGDVAALVEVTTQSVVERIRRLPPEVQRQLTAGEVFFGPLGRGLAEEAPVFADEVVRRVAAQRALRSNVSVEVRADELAGRPLQSVQEIEATLTQADLEEFFDDQAGG